MAGVLQKCGMGYIVPTSILTALQKEGAIICKCFLLVIIENFSKLVHIPEVTSVF